MEPKNSIPVFIAVLIGDNNNLEFGRLSTDVQSALEKVKDGNGFVIQALGPDFN